jgi:tetratricopeptide (TPR) repeat protein
MCIIHILAVMAKITARLTAQDEVPPRNTKAIGSFELELSPDGGISTYILHVANISNVTLVLIHQGTKGINGAVLMTLYKNSNPQGQINGILSEGRIFSNQFEGPLDGKYISDLMNLVREGQVYINVYTNQNPEGEIRGQLLNADEYITELEEITRYLYSARYREDILRTKYLTFLGRLEFLATLPLGKDQEAKIYYLIGYCLHSSSIDLKRALDNYNLALKNGFDEFWVVYNRGVLHMELGDIEAARIDLDRAVYLKPTHEGAKQFQEGVFLPSLLDKDQQPMTLPSAVVVCSIPKSGTILLRNILKSILGDNLVIPSNSFRRALATSEYLLALPRLTNLVYVGHIEYSEDLAKKLSSIPKIALIRDPRDYVVSYAHFMDRLAKDAEGVQKEWYEKYWSKKEWDEKLSSLIFGFNTRHVRKIYPSVFDSYVNYAIKWSGPNTLIVRYEDIIGTKFGGNDKTVIKTLKSIMDFVGVQIDDETLARRIAQGSDPAKSDTFRFGGKGNWRQEFKPHHVTQMKAVGPALLSTLGYELDESWSLNSISKKRIPSRINVDARSSIDLLLNNMPVLSEIQYLQIRKELAGNKGIETLIDEWALDLFIENEQYQYAISILEQLLNQEPSNPLWNYLYALSLHRPSKDLTKALLHYNSALANGFNEFLVKYNRGMLLIQMGDKDAAVADLERAQKLKPEDKTARETLMAIQTTI